MKVFVTVGSMLPFDRLVDATEAWAAAHPEAEVFAQVGDSARRPAAMGWTRMLAPREFRQRLDWADLVVAHAGMGTVLGALEAGRPLVVLPRRPEAREVTSAHQLATARWLAAHPGITVAEQAADLPAAIASALERREAVALAGGSREGLVAALRDFVQRP